MSKTLYLECASGISGDMVVGALLDAGASEEGLRAACASLNVAGFELRVSRKNANGLDACDFDVVLDEEHDGHDHDMAWLYGDLDGEGHGHHHHEHDHEHHHHDHDHGHHHHHEHRTPADIARIIDAANLTPHARELAHRIFDIVAKAESKAHGVPLEEVHFHEVGAVDSIVDVVAAAFCLDDLGVDEVVISPLAEGHGRIRSAHGVLSVPVPAVANIVADEGLVLQRRDTHGELVTPTGAAIAAAFRTTDELPASYRIVATGTGSGKRTYEPISTVRALVLESVEKPAVAPQADTLGKPHLWKLETEVDDCTGEALGLTLEHLYAAGAREAHFLPVFMKKNRPGYQIEVLCSEADIPALEEVIFNDTTTIGIRRTPLWRTALSRRAVEVATAYGPVLTKEVTLPSGEVRRYPEHDSVAACANQAGAAYQTVYRAALAGQPNA